MAVRQDEGGTRRKKLEGKEDTEEGRGRGLPVGTAARAGGRPTECREDRSGMGEGGREGTRGGSNKCSGGTCIKS